MKTRSSKEIVSFNPRIFTAFLLGSAAMWMAMLSLASTPSSGTLTDTSGPLEYTAGPFFQPNAFGNSIAGECDPDPSNPLVPCDVYRLTVTLPADYATTHPNQSVFVRVEWGTAAADFDLYLWDAVNWPESSFPTGSPITQSKQTATNFEQVEIPAVGGTRDLVVQVSTTLPAGQSFTGKIFLGPASPASVPVVPPGNASGIAPRFREYIPTDASARRPLAWVFSRASRRCSPIRKPAAFSIRACWKSCASSSTTAPHPRPRSGSRRTTRLTSVTK